METHPGQLLPVEMSVIDERLSVAARIGGSIRTGYESIKEIPRSIKTLGAVGTTALALFSASHAETASADPESVANDNVPALEGKILPGAPEASPRRPIINSYKMGVGRAVEVQGNGINYLDSVTPFAEIGSPPAPPQSLTPDQKQECIDAALNPPKIDASYVTNPGRKPYEHNPSVPGPIQTTIVQATYQAMPEECANDFRRVGLARLKKEVGDNKWATLSYTPEWIYTRNIAGSTQITHMESGHGAPDWVYLKPGEQEKLILKNKVKYLPSGKILDTRTKVRPIQIRWAKH